MRGFIGLREAYTPDTVALISIRKVCLILESNFILVNRWVWIVDDMFLESDIYSPSGTTFQITPADLAQHVTWMGTINAKLNAGSNYFVEVGHNGNGNIEVN